MAVFIVAIASSIRLLAPASIAPEGSFLMYFGAVMLAAWYGGLGPGLLATAISTLAVDYLLAPPQFTGGLF
jgi:K+-sensing histidine kinase KdpD